MSVVSFPSKPGLTEALIAKRLEDHAVCVARLLRGAVETPEAAPGLRKSADYHLRKVSELTLQLTGGE